MARLLMMNLDDLDLNLLRVFDAVLRRRSVTLAVRMPGTAGCASCCSSCTRSEEPVG
ncbi:MAG: hypothetical protein ACREVS_02640 [Burkholderiales bacterium]